MSMFDRLAFIAGVDEAGRGALAGPVIAAACILRSFLYPRKTPFISWSPVRNKRQAGHCLIADSKKTDAGATGDFLSMDIKTLCLRRRDDSGKRYRPDGHPALDRARHARSGAESRGASEAHVSSRRWAGQILVRLRAHLDHSRRRIGSVHCRGFHRRQGAPRPVDGRGIEDISAVRIRKAQRIWHRCSLQSA